MPEQNDQMGQNGLKTKKCPYCANDINEKATKCQYCTEWLDGRPPAIHSNGRSPLQFWLMYLCSFGLYLFWWYYKNWQQLKNHRGLNFSPVIRTIGLIVPLLSYYLLWLEFDEINRSAEDSGIVDYEDAIYLTFAFAVLNIIGSLAFITFRVFSAGTLIGMFCIIGEAYIIYQVQKTLNIYWKKEQLNLPMKKNFSWRQIFIAIVGGVYFALAFIGSILLITNNNI